jgi:hypothetical protein
MRYGWANRVTIAWDDADCCGGFGNLDGCAIPHAKSFTHSNSSNVDANTGDKTPRANWDAAAGFIGNHFS